MRLRLNRAHITILVLVCVTTLSCGAADRILFTRLGPSEANLLISNADGSGERALTKGTLDYNPAWSPDGKWIAFTSERDGSADLYRMRTDGSGLERLTDDPAFDDQAAFSPDGNQIVFVTTRAGGKANLWILDVTTHTGEAAHVRARRRLPAGVVAGREVDRVLFRSGEFVCRWQREMGAPAPRRYLSGPSGRQWIEATRHATATSAAARNGRATARVWSPIACSPRTPGRTGSGAVEGETTLMRIDVASGDATPVSAGPGVKIFPSVLPSGEVAYVRRDERAQGVFYAGGKAGPAGDVRWPSWSPDGSRVVYGKSQHRNASGDATEDLEPNPQLRTGQHGHLASVRSKRRALLWPPPWLRIFTIRRSC